MLLELKEITKTFDLPSGIETMTVLDKVSLEVDSGETVSITGPSGSGKSTLLNIIGSLDRPTSGSVRFSGQDISALSESEQAKTRNQEIGFIFQLHHLLRLIFKFLISASNHFQPFLNIIIFCQYNIS